MYGYEYNSRRAEYDVIYNHGELIYSFSDENSAAAFVDRENTALARTQVNKERRRKRMNENQYTDREKVAQRTNQGGFMTQTMKLKTGWVGQISAGGDSVVWDSEPFEDKNDAQKAANDKLTEKLKAMFD